MEATGPNAEQIRYWNETAGPKWVRLASMLDAQIAPFGRCAMDRAAIAPRERVIDVGCGCGDTTIELGRRVGAEGSVLGIDPSAPMLDYARQRARAAGLANVRFENGDAQTHHLEERAFDALFSRFGVMFFADPPAAFTNLRRALRPGGRLAFVCWQSIQQNPWMFLPVMAAAAHVTLPAPPPPGAPGPFAFADADRVRGILQQAGFESVAFESIEEQLTVGGVGLDQAVDFLMEMGPAAAALREAGPDVRPTVAAAIREAIAPFDTPDGVRMGSAIWIVTARCPKS